MNKIERLKTVFAGGVPDVTPAGFWFHYSGDLTPKQMAEAHLQLYREVGRFKFEEWARLVRPFDLQLLNVADIRVDKYNILHICGEPEYNFETHIDRFGDYPADLVNWSIKDNNYNLKRGKDFFKKAVLGGLNNKGNILSGTEEEIIGEVNEVLSNIGHDGFMLGADCTIQGEHISLKKIKTAVEAAHNYIKG